MKTITLLLFLGTVPAARAATTYQFTTFTGAVVDPGTTAVTVSHADDGGGVIALPFPVIFYGNVYNSVNVLTNGNLQFVSNSASLNNTTLPSSTINTMMAIHWDDLLLPSTTSGILTKLTGAAGSRVFNIEWRGGRFSSITGIDIEIQLFENQTFFDFIYGTVTPQGASATVGVQSSFASGDFTQFSYNSLSLSNGLRIRWDVVPTSVPEPAGFWLIAIGGLAFAASRRLARSDTRSTHERA
ncbi:MAG: PEP-CTERM sorting domain-containing protein [Acidobacteria bacterium]|nr:PEP-CTERM sorting domain-containing protein [Acidobacteriota bacterium]